MAAAVNVEKEALKITKLTPGKDRQSFLRRVVSFIEKLSDDGWEELSAALQKWYNTALKARDADKTIPDFPGAAKAEEDEEKPSRRGNKAAADEDEEEEEERPAKKSRKAAADEDSEDTAVEENDDAEVEGTGEDEEEEVATSKKKTGTASKKSSSAKKTSEKSTTTTKKSGGAGGRKLTAGAPTVIKQLLIKDPTLTKDEIAEKMKNKGLKLSALTVATQRNDFRHALRVLKDAGVFNREFAAKLADL